MFLKKGNTVTTIVEKPNYPKGTKGTINTLEKDKVLIEFNSSNQKGKSDLTYYKYSEIRQFSKEDIYIVDLRNVSLEKTSKDGNL